MKVIKPQTLSLLTRPFEFKREFWLGVAVAAFLPVGVTPVLLQESALWQFLAEELPPDQPLDAVIPKIRPEFLAVAHAFAPGGIPAAQIRTGIQLGPLIKMLDVFGDRVLDRDRAGPLLSHPIPFTSMALDWTRAYGGAGFADNPLGRGAVPVEGTEGRTFPVQNVINPKLGRDGVRIPAAYGPVDQMWPARLKLTGTYDDAWLKQDFPGFARDIDWRFFNTAQADQWLPDRLNGDETYAFKHLHPDQPLLKGRLPGLVPRLFLVRKSPREGGEFEEVPLSLTTVWFFPHRERVVLVHHGQARLAEEDASDIARAVVGADRLSALRPAEDFRAVMVKRADAEGGMMHALRDSDLVPGEWLVPDPATLKSEEEKAQLLQVFAHPRKRAERATAAAREQMKAKGLDPDKYPAPAMPPEPSIPTLDELPAIIAAARDEIAVQKAKSEADVAANKADVAKRLGASGMSAAEIQQRLEPKPQGPPAFSAAGVRADMAAQITAMRVLGQLTLELEAQLASPELAVQLDKAEAAIRNGYRRVAHHQGPPDALPADRSAEIRRLISGDTAAARAMYDLHGADLSDLDLSGLDLSGVCLDGADLTGTSFAGANLTNAVLAHARMQGCNLDDATLIGANLGKANLANATLKRAVLKKSVLAGADLTNASLAGADLERADLSDIITDGTDFSEVRAPGILAMKLSLPGLRAPGIVLTKAKFLECNLQGADLNGATLDRAVFLECNLVGIRLGRASLRKAGFVKQCSLLGANLAGADLTEANLRETNLRGANLNGAILTQADLSGADLSNALMNYVRANGSRLVAADLRRADLRLGDFAQADLSRADLRGANLTGVSVYGANLPRTKLDADTRRGGMFRKKLRYLPVYEPPAEAAT
jgi:uncharacterized protein YjbI with pentapeptide repeats